MKNISMILFSLLLISSFSLHAQEIPETDVQASPESHVQATPEKKLYTWGSLLRDATLVTGGSLCLFMSAYREWHHMKALGIIKIITDNPPPSSTGYEKCANYYPTWTHINFQRVKEHSSFFSYIAATIGIVLVSKGISNMFKHD